MWSLKRLIGNRGEDHACTFLKQSGFTIVERNFLRKCGEIDIICRKGNIYHFVEVKTVTREKGEVSPFRAEDNLHRAKFDRIVKTVAVYIEEKQLYADNWQIDALIIVIDRKGKLLNTEYLDNCLF